MGTPNENIREFSRLGDITSIKKVLETSPGAVFAADEDGYIPLICAAMEGHHEAALLLLSTGGNIHHETKHGYTALSHACANGHTGTAAMLIERGAHVDHEDHDKGTPLTLACAGGHTKTVMMLLSKGANIHHEAKHGRTPITYAANWGKTETAMMLINKGANVNHETIDGATPITRACANGHIETAIVLLEMGADIQHRDKKNRSPIDYIVDSSKREAMQRAVDSYLAQKQYKDQDAKSKQEWRIEEERSARLSEEYRILTDRFEYALKAVLAGRRVVPMQMTLLRDCASVLQAADIESIFSINKTSWEKLARLEKKTSIETEEINGLRKSGSCKTF